jgi:hypothetical protein
MNKAKATISVDFSDLFQRIKHKNYKVTAREYAAVVQFLSDPHSMSTYEAHAAIYVLCLSSPPSPEHVMLVERFLSDQANDYTRSAAITCLFTIWDLAEERHVSYVLNALERVMDRERSDSSFNAISSALNMMHATGRLDLSLALSRVFDDLHREVLREDTFATNMFISACLQLANAKARSMGQRPTYFHTLDEALEVYETKGGYLLQQIH